MATESRSAPAACARSSSVPLRAPGPKAWGLAVWVRPGANQEPNDALIACAAQELLERAQRIAPEVEVHFWPAAGAATSAVGINPGEGTRDGGNPEPSSSPAEDSPPKDDDGSSHLTPQCAAPGLLSVDLCTGPVLLDGTPVPLTGVERRVLQYLAENCSRPVGRNELQRVLESLEFPGCTPRSIDVYVGRLRRKFGPARHAIATVRGGGYQFIPGSRVTIRTPAEYAI
ncbi:winged helix-turn-helix domain-containing protein [Pseudarthrobacter sulfonivorans]|uniref:winged helix-turn-helix domain-containing protein n=1 Tax=Pseudarthrobacter sulfonivorans TaxID=121292 RepID=UPI00210694E1|nr:winged helix-turn-helix domain-containing protein [Pseudarthrobacter sulfonivorans]